MFVTETFYHVYPPEESKIIKGTPGFFGRPDRKDNETPVTKIYKRFNQVTGEPYVRVDFYYECTCSDDGCELGLMNLDRTDVSSKHLEKLCNILK